MSALTVRRWSEADVRTIEKWAGDLGWAIGKLDLWVSYQVFNHETIALEKNGLLLGVALAIRQSGNRGLLGWVIAREDMRGKRIGTELMKLAMKHLEGRNVLVDSGDRAQHLYNRHGLNIYSQVTNVYRGQLPDFLKTPSNSSKDYSIERVTNVDEILENDESLFKIECSLRRDYWQLYIDAGMELFMAKRDGKVVGLAGHCSSISDACCAKLGPLHAEDEAMAKELCIAIFQGKMGITSIRSYTPGPNEKANRFFENVMGMQADHHTYRYFSDFDEKFDVSQVYSMLNIAMRQM